LIYPFRTITRDPEANATSHCTERDSRKDEAIVFIFIIATGGLLIWAVFRPWVQKWIEVWIHGRYEDWKMVEELTII
jgi:hypothetical protein